MSDTHPQSYEVNTHETAATAPARRAALQAIANYSDRKLCLFHYEVAKDTLSFLEHEIRHYGDGGVEADPIRESDAAEIIAMIDKITDSLALVRAIAHEAGQHTARSLPEGLNAPLSQAEIEARLAKNGA